MTIIALVWLYIRHAKKRHGTADDRDTFLPTESVVDCNGNQTVAQQGVFELSAARGPFELSARQRRGELPDTSRSEPEAPPKTNQTVVL